ncbi:MAG: hypothetical protein PW845_01510 [Pseudomonas sp.]|uniref:hypothetical protein n=1 Tax=Pseudomonas abieticivorans TaxID=2931382 RepID=UPI0020BF0920|nr:hypothetical protein [Pseudomonas sp. PIA16]MDE1164070.1 hypothetical protein [Pseudomonas sp.]
MSRRTSLVLLLVLLALSLLASYSLRYGLMEDAKWVGLCSDEASRWECQLRSGLGWLIHFRYIAFAALTSSVVAFFVRGCFGWWLAALALVIGVPALVLYSASLGVFAVVIAGLRLVR